MDKLNACQELETKVIEGGLCTLCGACLGMCPYLLIYKGRIILRDICTISENRCTTFCPRISVDLENLSKSIFGVSYVWDELGTVQQVFMARSADAGVRARAQDAGIVSALTVLALEEGLIDSAVLTRFQDKSLPEGMIASARHEVLECAGSSYIAAPTIEAFNRAIQQDDQKNIGVIGTPCQVLALAKMRAAPPEMCKKMDELKLVIGLFCTWALSYDFTQFLEREVEDRIIKYNVPPHPAEVFQAFTENGQFDIPLEKVLPFVRPSCQTCPDLTAEFADISVGGGRGEMLDWNTVVVRTETGMRLIDAAVEKGIIETRDIPEQNLTRLKAASLNKKKRALKNIIQKTGTSDDLLYLKARAEMIEPLLEK